MSSNDSFIESVRKDLIEDHLAAARAAWLAEISISSRASISPSVPTRHLGLAHGQHMDTVTPGHFCGEGRS